MSNRARTGVLRAANESSRQGPATSTVPFTGLPTAILATALATSSAAMGWMSMVPHEPVLDLAEPARA